MCVRQDSQRCAYVEVAGLVVQAVGARNQLAVGALARKPGLEVVFAGRGEVEVARDNVDDLIREADRLAEILGGLDHGVEHLPRFGGVAEHKLLDLLKLVDPEDALGVAAVRPNLLAEALGDAAVLDRERLGVDVLLSVVRGNRLLGCGDQELLLGRGVALDLATLPRDLGTHVWAGNKGIEIRFVSTNQCPNQTGTDKRPHNTGGWWADDYHGDPPPPSPPLTNEGCESRESRRTL